MGIASQLPTLSNSYPPPLSDENADKVIDAVRLSEMGMRFVNLAIKELPLVAAMTYDPSMYGKANNAKKADNAKIPFPTEGTDPPNLLSLFVAGLLHPSISSFSFKRVYSSHLSQFISVCSATIDGETLEWSRRCCSNCLSCFSKFNKYPRKNVEWRKITAKTKAKKQDWGPHVGKTFCEPCYAFYARKGHLDNSARQSASDVAGLAGFFSSITGPATTGPATSNRDLGVQGLRAGVESVADCEVELMDFTTCLKSHPDPESP